MYESIIEGDIQTDIGGELFSCFLLSSSGLLRLRRLIVSLFYYHLACLTHKNLRCKNIHFFLTRDILIKKIKKNKGGGESKTIINYK